MRGSNQLRWSLSLLALGVVGALLLSSCSAREESENVRVHRAALGEPQDGFPEWQERVIYVWTNRARCDPAADLASCSNCAEAGCYSPTHPLAWRHGLARAARFHSSNLVLGGCSLQHSSPCTLYSDISTRYTPGPCNGDPSCACQSGFACGSSGTNTSTRVGYFDPSGGGWENIARGSSNPVNTFYQWIHESTSNPTCSFTMENGHRHNILNPTLDGIGVGRNSTTWTQDFNTAGSVDGLISGVHYPQTGSSIEFRANWYQTPGPGSAQVNVDGSCHTMTVERGNATNGTYLATVSGLSGCQRYFFHFTTGAGADAFYPTTGSFGIGCSNDWENTRPSACGCTPDCSGKQCGGDGCGGSCGTCTGGKNCNGAGQCVCPSGEIDCSGTCVDTDTDHDNCGGCSQPCAANEVCQGGNCVCTPDCAGKACGDDGCGAACGTCSGGTVCNASFQCVCPSGTTDCSGTCVDTDTDENHCGGCNQPCSGSEICVSGSCQSTCTPDCTGLQCGDDGCGGSCGTCSGGRVCNASGQCVCPVGQTDCSGACVDTNTDENHCGGCNQPCSASEICTSGSCQSTCTPDCTGLDCGDDGCGGSCGTCPTGKTCNASGRCVCAPGETDCSGTCVNTDTDEDHCGGCDSPCSSGEFCVSGSCESSCTPDCTGRDCGDDGCTGTCGTCTPDRVCDTSGQCVCPPGETDCSSVCVNTNTDLANCGSCDNACVGADTCVAGQCECVPSCTGRECGDDLCGDVCGSCGTDMTCASGGNCVCNGSLVNCGGSCVDVRNDADHCGACGNPCGSGEVCIASNCETGGPDAGCVPDCTGRACGDDGCGGVCGDCDVGWTCAAGGQCLCTGEMTECGAECVDTRTSDLHCGACDNACDSGSRCVGGTCSGAGDGGPQVDGGDPGDGGTVPTDASAEGGVFVMPEDDEGGCGCTTPGRRPLSPFTTLVVLAGSLFVFGLRRGSR